MSRLRILSGKDIAAAITMHEAIHLMKDAFLALSSDRVQVPLRMNLSLEEHQGRALFMPVYSAHHAQVGMKLVHINPENPEQGLPLIHALVTLSDAHTGRPLAVMDGDIITSLRTGAGAGLATDILARPESSVLAVFGTGTQARSQVEAICAVRPIRKIIVFGLCQKSIRAFVQHVEEYLRIFTAKAASDEELSEADIVCTATTSISPVFSPKHIAPGTHINGIGSYQPEMAEIPSDTVAKAKVIVDEREACLREAGDLVIPIQQKRFRESHIHAELGEILAEKKTGRTDNSEITFFKSVGNAIQDLVVANFLEKRARQMNLGTVATL